MSHALWVCGRCGNEHHLPHQRRLYLLFMRQPLYCPHCEWESPFEKHSPWDQLRMILPLLLPIWLFNLVFKQPRAERRHWRKSLLEATWKS